MLTPHYHGRLTVTQMDCWWNAAMKNMTRGPKALSMNGTRSLVGLRMSGVVFATASRCGKAPDFTVWIMTKYNADALNATKIGSDHCSLRVWGVASAMVGERPN